MPVGAMLAAERKREVLVAGDSSGVVELRDLDLARSRVATSERRAWSAPHELEEHRVPGAPYRGSDWKSSGPLEAAPNTMRKRARERERTRLSGSDDAPARDRTPLVRSKHTDANRSFARARTHDLRATFWTPGSLIILFMAGRTLFFVLGV